jgi:hypothetical protein
MLNFQLRISDVSGKIILSQPLEGVQGQWIWKTEAVSSGNYFYHVIDNGRSLCSGKIVVSQ